MEIQGKVALVTGGGSGIGEAAAVRLGRDGASVLVVDRDMAGAERVAAAIRAAGGKARAHAADVTDEAALGAAIEAAETAFGGLDIMLNNAGVVTGQPGWPQASSAQWGRTLDINLRAVILGTQLAIPALIRRGGGAIVNTASIAGLMGFPPDPVYSATKGGVVLFTRSLAPLKDSDKIRVNCVCPGFVDTPLLQGLSGAAAPQAAAMLNALPKLTSDDVADAIVSLITDDSLAGQALQIAAGQERQFVSAPSLASILGGAARG